MDANKQITESLDALREEHGANAVKRAFEESETMRIAGEVIRDSIMDLRHSAQSLLNQAEDLEKAWAKWDIEVLVELSGLPEFFAEKVAAIRARHCKE